MNKFKKFSSKESRQDVIDMTGKEKFRAWTRHKESLAAQATEFGGRRLLGITKKGNAIWAQYYIDKQTLDMQVSLTHDIETIRKSTLCPRRITLARGENLADLDYAMRPKTAKDLGEVTLNTLRYIDKLFNMSNANIGKIKGKCSTQLFMMISNTIYEGSSEAGKFRWQDIMRTWDLPSGKYFTVYG